MCLNRFHIVFLFLSDHCTPNTLSKEAFEYFVCPTEIPQPPFAWNIICVPTIDLLYIFLWSWQPPWAISANHIFLYTSISFDTTFPLSSLTFTDLILLDTRWPTPHQTWLVGYVDSQTIDCQRPACPTCVLSFSSCTIPIPAVISSSFSHLFPV